MKTKKTKRVYEFDPNSLNDKHKQKIDIAADSNLTNVGGYINLCTRVKMLRSGR